MSDSLPLLEWPALFEHLKQQCLTPYGARAWEAQPFLDDAESVERHLVEVDALKVLLMRYGEGTADTRLPDITPVVRRLSKGGFLTLDELRQVMRTLQGGGKLLGHFARSLRSEPKLESTLSALLDEDQVPHAVMAHLSLFIDNSGEIRDSASPELSRLRARLRHQRHAIQQRLQHYLTGSDYAGALQSSTPTEREGRTVLAVKVEAKSKLPGVIHGASASGSTIYVEPQDLVGLNNDFAATQAELQRELERILRELSLYLQAHWEPLDRFIEALGHLDRRLAAARQSRILEAMPVTVVRDGHCLDLKQARHPLLVIQMQKEALSRAVVPNDLRLGEDGIRTLVITGPNTGGKTVLLKMAGLFAWMLRAGLHLPVGEGSRMALFDPILADIGDQQSIAQSLSTFSAHIHRLKSFMEAGTDLTRGLVVIDEIAAGTDPAEGAALAKAILDELYAKGALTLVSTHLGELKVDAHQHPGFMNASVEFDAETLSPTYRLILGVPGASNAITIAQKLGVSESVIRRAKMSLSAPVRESADLLQELETKNRQLEEELQRARSYRLEAQQEYEKLAYERQLLEEEKRQALKQFQISLKSRIHELERQVKILRKEMQQEESRNLEKINERLRETGRQADAVFGDAREALGHVQSLSIADIKPGDTVFSRQLEVTGEVLAVMPDSQEVTLQSGILRVTVPVADLEKPHARSPIKRARVSARPAAAVSAPPKGPSVLEEPRDASLTCDVRGQRVEEALRTVEKFLDDALLSGFETVAIVHGLGTGALKKEIRQLLAQNPAVKRYYPAEARLGGDGKTIVEL